MPSIAIGDIHGNLTALDDLLAQLTPTLSSDDTVVRILRFREESPAIVVTLCGNHEDWLMVTMRDHTRHSWLLAMDVFPTIESYSRDAADTLRAAMGDVGSAALYSESTRLPYDAFFEALPSSHREFFKNLRLFHETEDGVFAHAGLDTTVLELREQSRFAVLMGTLDFVDGHCGPPVVVYGHRNNAVLQDGWPHPKVSSWTIGIDTISHGVLTAVRLPERSVMQSARYR